MKPTACCLRYLLLLALLTLVQGCGFQLRGSGTSSMQLPADIGPVLIQGLSQHDTLRLELEQRLIDGNIKLAESAADAANILRISERKSDRRTQTVDSKGKVLEYELRESVSFQLNDRAGNQRVPMQSVGTSAIYTYQKGVLGSKQEENFLRKDLWRRLADQIVIRLSRQLH